MNNISSSSFLNLVEESRFEFVNPANLFKPLHIILKLVVFAKELGFDPLFEVKLLFIVIDLLLEPFNLGLSECLLLEQPGNLLSLIPIMSLELSNLGTHFCNGVVEHLLEVFEFLLVHGELNFKFLHGFAQFVLLGLVLLADRGDEGLVLGAQGSLVELVLLLQHPNHVRVVDAHALYQVLVVPLRPGLARQAVLHLLLQGGVVPVQGLHAVLGPLQLSPQLLDQLALRTGHSLLLPDVLSELFVLGLHLFQILVGVLESLELSIQIVNSGR